MIIGVDYTAAAWQGAGIGRYTRELLAAAIPRDRALRYVLFYAAGGLPPNSPYLRDLADLCAANPNVRARPIPISPRLLTILWQRLRLPIPVESLIGKIDILHAPDFVLPPTRARALLTVHDLTFMARPETADAGLRRYLMAAVPRSLRRADMVLADSQATRADLGRLLGVDVGRVRVLYPGVSPRFRPLPAAACEPLRAQLGLPESFLLFVGTLEPRKNLVRLIEAFGRLSDMGAHPGLSLVIAGRRGWLYEEIFAAVDRLGLAERVYFLDFIDDSHLPGVYNLARAFVYPSLYEGFGLPALEAMACGTPVVTANLSSLPEVVGDAAVLVDPLNPDVIADGILRALDDAGRLRAAGPIQARRFSWETAADGLIDTYRALAGPR
ncbi:glycosyltransferase family 4 protein [Chloroflexales bacterium ZM16-3]|nr:glycosyltransferase family 4 protein [Chloroflexales bacterium ZM16-3]